MRKRLLSRPAALAAAASLGMTGVFVTVPATATETAPTDVDALMEELKDTEGVQGVATDPSGDVAIFQLEGEKSRDVSAFAGKHSNVEVIELNEPLQAHARTDVVGGAGYIASPEGPGRPGLCSIGFTGWDASGNPAIITAGHCNDLGRLNTVHRTVPSKDKVPGSQTAGEHLDDAPLGDFTFAQFGGTNDAPAVPRSDGNFYYQDAPENATDIAVIDVTNTSVDLLPEVTDWTTQDTDDLAASTTQVKSVGAPTKGEPVTKIGRTTGVTEDPSLDYTDGLYLVSHPGGTSHWVRGFSDVGLRAEGGDSGGAVMQGNKAIGVTSGGGTDNENRPIFIGTSLTHGLEQTDGYTVALHIDAPAATTNEVEAGGTISGTAPAGTTVTVTGPDGDVDVTTDADGNWSFTAPGTAGSYSFTAVAEKGHDSSEPTQFTVAVTAAEEEPTPDPDPSDDPSASPSAEPSDDPTPTPTEDPTAPAPTDEPTEEAPAERELSIDPSRVTVSDFVNEDEGVNITATGYAPGQTVELEVFPQNDSVNDFTLEGTADENGVVTFGVYGTNAANADVYLGTYEVRVAASDDDAANAGSEAAPAAGAYAAGDSDEPLTGSFEVVADEGAAPGEDDENGEGSLPRTGSELTGLGVGAGLLVAGAAAVYVTTRRTKKGQA